MLRQQATPKWAGLFVAADLGLEPGRWPETFRAAGRTWRRLSPASGEVWGARYGAGPEVILVVRETST